jgi:two-component system LytT family response regulator
MSIRTLLVDDERPARRKMRRFLDATSDFEVIGEAADGVEAIAAIARLPPDVVFLDVQMPKLDGFAVAAALTPPLPEIVFVTAHDQFALKAFEVHALDYLLKPYDDQRFQRVLDRVRERRRQSGGGDVVEHLQRLIADLKRHPEPASRILINENERAFFIAAADVAWIESSRNYIVLHVGTKSHMIRGTLDAFSNKLNAAEFVRVNRSAIVRLDSIHELQPWFHGEYKILMKDGTTIPWTRRYITAEASKRILGH